MKNISPLVMKDFYKTSHISQYPEGTTLVYSNFTPRYSRVEGVNEVVVFGIRYLIKQYLVNEFDDNFFGKPKEQVLKKYKRRLDNALGKDSVDISHIAELHDLGYLPLEIKALPEGTLCPINVPCLTIKNTHPKFFWLTNFLETIISTCLWLPMTSATTAYRYRVLADEYAKKTSDIPEFVDWQCHDFSMRGLACLEAVCLSGAAHLLSFRGTDTIPAIDFLEEYYDADSDKELIGGSVPATEHSVMCMGTMENELNTFKRLITETYPKGIVSIVSDTWDYWKVIGEYLPALKDVIMARDGKVVIRPDSSPKTPVEIICGGPEAGKGLYYAGSSLERKGTVEALWDIFGGTINSKGYKQLDSHIGLIYGDSITYERAKDIFEKLEAKGFASTNVVFGVGSYTYQYVTRDTYGFAMKATYGEVNGEPRPIYKDPKTDPGVKKSHKGLLAVQRGPDGKLMVKQNVTSNEEKFNNLLKTVYSDGVIYSSNSLSKIRGLLKK